MGLKKTLKKVAKAAVPLVGLYAASKMGRLGRKKPPVKKYFGNDGSLGDANIAENIAGWNRGMNRIAEAGGVANLKKGGLVKKGKPKLAKRGWK